MIKKIIYLVLITIFVVISGCKSSTSSSGTKVRWKKVEQSGEETACAVHVRSDSTEMYIVTEEKFMKFVQGVDEPVLVKELKYRFSSENMYCMYNPYIIDDYFFYCSIDGQNMYVCNTKSGEEIGNLRISELVDSTFYDAAYTISTYCYNSLHIKSNKDKYMISLNQEIGTDFMKRKLYYGYFDFTDSLTFVTEEVFNGFPPNASSVGNFVDSNFFYNDKYWQYIFLVDCDPLITIEPESKTVTYTYIVPTLYDLYSYDDYTIGLFRSCVKKSYDGGFIWEDWIDYSGDWRTGWINGLLVLHFSHNYASIDVETEEVVNYENGELEHNNIIHMAEFDNKAYALTQNGLFYSTFEDCFKPKTNSRTNSREDTDLIIYKH